MLTAQAATQSIVNIANLNLEFVANALEFRSLRYMVVLLQNEIKVDVQVRQTNGSVDKVKEARARRQLRESYDLR